MLKVLAFYNPQLKLWADIFRVLVYGKISVHGFIRGLICEFLHLLKRF